MTGFIFGTVFAMCACSAYLIIAYYVYAVAFKGNRRYTSELALPGSSVLKVSDERMLKLSEDINESYYEEIEILSYDGTKLYGRYYHLSDSAPLDIHFHGYKSRADRDCCGTFRISRDMRHNVLLVDQRAHGKSGGSTITFGVKERYDCVAWANYAAERFGREKKIILIGLSMGAATVVMASGLELPQNVVGIISDSTYTSPRDILLKVGKSKNYPEKLINVFIAPGAFIFGHFDPDSASCTEAVKNSKLPMLFLHGEDDFFIPSRMSRKVYSSCGNNKKLVLLSNGGHCAGYIFNTEKYIDAIHSFYEKVLNEKRTA